jgi:hypothetical protein
VLDAVKVWAGKAEHAARSVRRPTLTKKRDLGSNKETDERKRYADTPTSLTKKAPYKETAGKRLGYGELNAAVGLLWKPLYWVARYPRASEGRYVAADGTMVCR